ncbi:MAG TPA: hypothetical protein VF488_00980, partial [Gemmatimonadaceae bacterium]
MGLDFLYPARDLSLPRGLYIRALPTEADARRDAVERGGVDAATTCAPQRMVADLLSAVAEPRAWRCAPRDGGFACGFD